MAAPPLPPDWSDARRSGPPLGRYQGTPLAGGVLWLAPLVLLPAAVVSVARDGSFAALMAGMGLVVAAPLVAAWLQTIELFPRHLIWRKWGRTRAVGYSDIEAIRSGKRAQAAQGSRAGLIEQRFIDLRLRDGATITFIEMGRHEELARRLSEALAACEAGDALSAAARARGAGHAD
ncbi:MAG TPA: hypothetical protein VNN80_22155 [Polyangiaceae bacterium]|nr:hypothetical protein [Polyangiaceae bacterium]